ncbi:MAG: cupin domain-containing protein, partial [Verrucomicrobiota bacterium]
PKRFLKKELASTSVELSLNSMPPGAEMPFIHRHRENEEIYIFLEGSGEFLADGTVIPINDGTCIRCNPTVERSWRNTGETPMRFLCLQGKAGSFLTGGTVRDGEIVAGKPQWESSAG